MRLPNPLRRLLSMPKCAARSISSSRRLALSQGRINLISDSSDSLGYLFQFLPPNITQKRWVWPFYLTKNVRPCTHVKGLCLSWLRISKVYKHCFNHKLQPQSVEKNLKCNDFLISNYSNQFPTFKDFGMALVEVLKRSWSKNAARSWYQLTLKDPSISVHFHLDGRDLYTRFVHKIYVQQYVDTLVRNYPTK